MPEMKCQYWTGKDWSRPSWCRNSAALASVARSPRIRKAGSPGTRWIMLKMINVTPKRTKIISSNRLRIYAPRPTLLVHPHVFEAVVRETVDEEALHILLPPRRRGRIGEEDERRVVQIGLLDIRVRRRA